MPFRGSGSLGLVAGVLYTALLFIAAAGDIRTRRISNRLVMVIMVCGLAYSVLAAPLAPGALRGVGGLLTGFGCWLPFYMVGWLGAGDVKMFAAAGAWLGPLQALEGALIAAVAGAVLALVWMIGTSGAKRVATTLAMAAAQPSLLAPAAVRTTHRNTLPYGVALAFGALVAGWLPGLLF